MWLGVGAGLPLLTWILVRPVYASNVPFNDQQLTYEGRGWFTAAAPQECSDISPTVHTTSITGDFVTFNFTGNGVSVLGPVTTLSTPVTILIDGVVKPVAPPILGDDRCGILFTDSNLDGSQEHVLTMVFSAASGSVQYSISGLTVDTLDPLPVVNNPMTQSILPLSTVPSPTPSAASAINASPSSSPISTPSSVSSAPALAMSSGGANNPSSSGSDSSSSNNGPTSFATSPGTIIGAIVGAIMAMLGLLVFFVLLRRRMTRRHARRLDQENPDRWGQDFDDSKGKMQVESGSTPIWSSKAGEFPQSASGKISREKETLIMNVPTTAVPEPVASVERTQPHQAVSISYQSTASTYTVPLEAALRRRSSVSDAGSDKHSLSDFPPVPGPSRLPPPPINVPSIPPTLPIMSSIPFSHTIPRLATASSVDPTSAYSAAATVGEGAGQDGGGLRVVNWSETIDTPSPYARKLPALPQPPPGFI